MKAHGQPASSPEPGAPRWLLLVHQLPVRPSNVRVKTWRRLQHLGAVAVKDSVYLLPNTPQAREDFEWLKTDRKSTRLNSSHIQKSRMPSSA